MKAYSYKADPAVPAFDDSHPIVFMDAECALCTGAARFIARFDRSGEFRICPIQSPLGSVMMTHFGYDARDPRSWLYLENGVAFGASDGVLKAAKRLGGPFKLALVFWIVPRRIRDAVYNAVARSRYRLFGKADMCAAPDEALKRRLIG